MRINRRKIFLTVVVAISLALLAGTFVSNFVRTRAGKGDFAALYKNSVHARQTGSLADPNSLGYYPPSGRPILMVLSLFPLQVGAIVWWVLGAGLHLICLYLLIKHLLPWTSRDPALLAAGVYLALLPWIAADLSGGNISPLILASMVVCYFFYTQGRPWLGGLALAVGVAVKFLPVFMIFYFAIKRRWKMTFISVACTLAVGILPSVICFGPRDFFGSWKTWSADALARRTGSYMILESRGISYINQSLANVLLHTLSPVSAGHHDKPVFVNLADWPRPVIFKIWLGLTLAGALGWLAMVWPRKNDSPPMERLHFAAVCLPMIAFSPHVMSYYLTILLPAVVILLWGLMEIETARPSLVVLLSLYALGCLLTASFHARAYGNYLCIILILALAVVRLSRTLRAAPDEMDLTARLAAG